MNIDQWTIKAQEGLEAATQIARGRIFVAPSLLGCDIMENEACQGRRYT
jgi:hypothetical protein